MGRIVLTIVLFILVISISCCAILDNGFIDQYGHYVPKHPRFKLKDKQGVYPFGLDTIGVYKMVESYNNGTLIYPVYNINDLPYDLSRSMNTAEFYIKFYPNGRCLFFSVPISEHDYGVSSLLEEKHLNPNNQYSLKCYYYSQDDENIQTEAFVRGGGSSHYVINNYQIKDNGFILIDEDHYSKDIYKKITIPTTWNKYPVDW